MWGGACGEVRADPKGREALPYYMEALRAGTSLPKEGRASTRKDFCDPKGRTACGAVRAEGRCGLKPFLMPWTPFGLRLFEPFEPRHEARFFMVCRGGGGGWGGWEQGEAGRLADGRPSEVDGLRVILIERRCGGQEKMRAVFLRVRNSSHGWGKRRCVDCGWSALEPRAMIPQAG